MSMSRSSDSLDGGEGDKSLGISIQSLVDDSSEMTTQSGLRQAQNSPSVFHRSDHGNLVSDGIQASRHPEQPPRFEPRSPSISGLTTNEILESSSVQNSVPNEAREHPLYQHATTEPDGLYHCPWEGKDPSCNHKPEKLRCNYK
jgi:hypothetical protein